MKRIKLDELSNFIINDINENRFVGYTTDERHDMHGTRYEILKNEKKYYFVERVLHKNIFASEEYLLTALLSDEIQAIEDGEIYAHGYPESRLIPANHMEKCEECFLENVTGDFRDKISNILRDYFKS